MLFERVADRRRASGDDEEQDGNAIDDLGQARDDGVDPAAEVAGDRAEQHADRDRAERREQRDLERDLRAVEEAQELVAAERAVGAERSSVRSSAAGARVRSRAMCVHGPTGAAVRVERRRRNGRSGRGPRKCARSARRRTRRGASRKIVKPPRDRDLVAPEPAPDLLPVAARLDLDLAELGRRLERDRRRRPAPRSSLLLTMDCDITSAVGTTDGAPICRCDAKIQRSSSTNDAIKRPRSSR